jgi:Glucanosyltransferase/X8 domain
MFLSFLRTYARTNIPHSEWCGNSSFQASYAGVESDFSDYNVPAYFSEFGCITSPPRLWTEVAALFSSLMSTAWSGGIAFSYFPDASVQGQFGMVNISADGSSVMTGDDFNLLASQYGQVNPPNTPSQSAAGNTNYPTCPAQSATFLASSSLPPTPNDQSCQCLDTTLSCLFTPQTDNYTDIVGELLDTGCSLLGQAGGNCNDIAANGTSGSYGRVSFCDPRKYLTGFWCHVLVDYSFILPHSYQAVIRFQRILPSQQPQSTILQLCWQCYRQHHSTLRRVFGQCCCHIMFC